MNKCMRILTMILTFMLSLTMLPMTASAQNNDVATNSTSEYAKELRIAGLDGSETWLNEDYSGYYRVVIGGDAWGCDEAYSQALLLSDQSAYKDIKFFALDVDGDGGAFSLRFSQYHENNFVFASTYDETYDDWFSDLLFNPHSPFWIQSSEASLPFLAMIDKDGRVVHATSGAQDIEYLINDYFGNENRQAYISTITNVRLGDGYTVHADETVDQRGMARAALDAVAKWRRDALTNNLEIQNNRGEYIPIRDLLQDYNISEADYLKPRWSQELEYIALQRVIEAYDSSLQHSRPNGTRCFSARLDTVKTTKEILAWVIRTYLKQSTLVGLAKKQIILNSCGEKTMGKLATIWR